MARRARALTGFALLLLAPCAGSAASAAQTHATATRHAPKLEDLPGIAGRLREALAGVPTSEVEEFARQVYFEAGCPRPQLAGVAWPALLADLGAILREVGIAPNVKAYLDLQEAYFVASTLGQRASALEIIQRALREAPAHAEDRADLAFLAANLESEEEHWSEMREYLQLAEEALPDAKPGSGIDLRVNAGWARLWIQFALPELARPRVEAELACARRLGTPWARSLARIDQLQLLNSEEDYEALDRMGDELFCEDWWSSASPQDQGSALLIVAAGWLTREHDELVPRGEAEWRLDQLRGAGRVSNDLRGWVLRHAASSAADGADWPRARALCAELACELAGSVGAPDRVERLRPHLERLHRSWDEFLAHWAQAPLRSGGLPYLFIAEHHQVIQELIELQIAVEGEEVGTRRGLVDLLQAQVLGTLSRRLQSASVTIEDVQRALCPEGAGVLLYFPSRDRSFVFAIDARGVRLFRLPPAHQLRQPCRALALAVQEAVHSHQGLDEPELRDAAAALARDVVPEDLARWIEGWSTVRVIGADDVGYLPFELLPAPNGGTRGARQAISYCASLPLAVALERAAAKPFAGGSRLVIAPDSDEPGMGLVIEAAEREALESMLPAPKVVSDGPRADTRALALAPGDSVALLHVLAHGRQDRTRERPGGLRLANGVAWAEDVEAQPSPPLVLLTACEAGRAPLRRGDGGRSDLAAAFLVAGARCVVLPACDLELEGTLRAAPLALQHLAAGECAAEALRATREELAERDPVAALQAHLLHVVGAGSTRLAAREGAAGGTRGLSSGLVPALLACVAAVLWFAVRRRRAKGASGAVD